MNALILSLIITPLLASLLFFKGIKYSTIISGITEVIISLLLLKDVPITCTFYVTEFTWYFVLMVSSIYLLSTLFSISYLNGEKTKISERTYFLLLNFFASSMFFALVINNLGLMWVGIEATTISTILLVITEGTDTAMEVGWRYTIIVSAGVTFAFISIILVYYSTHSLTVSYLIMNHSPSLTLRIASAIALVGFGTKVGVFPVNTWLPDAHSEAPAPISAMFSGVLLPVALYVLYQFYEICPIFTLYSWISTISIVIASISMASQVFFKRLFAYSTIENINLALLGLASGQILGAVILLISHAFGKAGAFYSSGLLIKTYESKRIEEYGLWKSKFASYSLLLSSLAVTGTPPFGTFIGEFLILSSLVRKCIIEFIIILIALSTAFISVNYHVSKMTFKGEKEPLNENSTLGIISLISAIISLAIGIFIIIWWSL
ncbi:proton-conducting transporter membrane subunit [Acidianus sp. HS-5]|uniref:proton-conducting transporter transmembrane domain-containing protein n=1 Tax=Acidianus sp. HS-5 TaxID=2886040 RepID=UPI001F16B053|nr:proton-conducting transporter membrane subunit [Acidianus sp. HS-5]